VPVIHPDRAVVHDLHGTRFTVYAAPGSGSSELCAWQAEIPSGSVGVPHRITREEVFLVLDGTLRVTLDGAVHDLTPGDVLVAPAGSQLQADNPGDQPVRSWVTTSVGLRAALPDGTWITPPWVQ